VVYASLIAHPMPVLESAIKQIGSQHGDWVHGVFAETAGAAPGGAEKGRLPCIADAGGVDVGIEIGLEIVVRRHLMPFAAFLVQPDPPALTLGVVVLDPHGDDSAYAGEGEGHDADQRPIAQPDDGRGVDAVQQLACLFRIQHRGLPVLTTCFGPRTECAGLVATVWLVTSQLNSMRMAARWCFTVGFSKSFPKASI
jgi:hypothetical protein